VFSEASLCFERVLGGRRFVWLNDFLLSFDEDDETYLDAVFDALDPKVKIVKGAVSDADAALANIDAWEDDLKEDINRFPGGRPPQNSIGDFTYDDDLGYYILDDPATDFVMVFCNGDYLLYDEEEVENGSMMRELAAMKYQALMDLEETEENFEERMWGLVSEESDDEKYYNWGCGGGAIEGGYDIDEDLAGIRDSILEDK
jgi:hypothetical protein